MLVVLLRWGHNNFNPRAYVRHDRGHNYHVSMYLHFNPRAYVRHDTRAAEWPGEVHISIHVPT